MDLHFYRCDVCGKIIAIFSGNGIPTICCGREMRELIPNRTDAAIEKHVPVISAAGDRVTVRIGSAPHPMTGEHGICWIGLRTTGGFAFRELRPGDCPEAIFSLSPGEHVEAAYAYCNLHGLWCSEKEAES